MVFVRDAHLGDEPPCPWIHKHLQLRWVKDKISTHNARGSIDATFTFFFGHIFTGWVLLAFEHKSNSLHAPWKLSGYVVWFEGSHMRGGITMWMDGLERSGEKRTPDMTLVTNCWLLSEFSIWLRVILTSSSPTTMKKERQRSGISTVSTKTRTKQWSRSWSKEYRTHLDQPEHHQAWAFFWTCANWTCG